ncbi:MAG: hypothetical protein IKY12_02110, partial [Clostridia bacterium]|nr:hypothetical protein [Clostridia bacterium]
MANFKKILAILICLVIFTTSLSSLSFALKVNDIFDRDLNDLDYSSLLYSAYIINGSWTASDLANGKYLTFSYRGEKITEKYNSARHFSNFDAAYNYYLSQNPDILTDLPVFIFAPGTYNSLITVRYSAIILGANAGINPNAQHDWSLDGVENGVAMNSERTEETVFTKGITRTTRTSNGDAKWAYELETAEMAAGKKAEIKLIVDGVKITGSVGISHYDYSNRAYTSSDGLTLNGQAFNYTFDGNRTTLTAFTHSVVDNFSGSGANALFSARCDSKNKNDAILLNVRMTNIRSSAKFLFNKYFRNLTIDGLYYANNQTALFGSITTGSSFCGSSSAKTA